MEDLLFKYRNFFTNDSTHSNFGIHDEDFNELSKEIKELLYKAFLARTTEKKYRLIHRKEPIEDFEKWLTKTLNKK